MKVVINRCFGGFGLSIEAARHMAAAGHKEAAREVADYEATCTAFDHYKRHGKPLEGRYEGEAGFFDINIKYGSTPDFHGGYGDYSRHDPLLVAAVEALGQKANGKHAALAVVEIPDGTDYEIAEYDGSEHIAEKHQTWR